MNMSNDGALDATSLAITWGRRLMRFYLLICADRRLAEASAFETLEDAVHSGRGLSSSSALIRLAVARSSRLRFDTPNGHGIECAVSSLPSKQRLVIALFRGMGIGIEEVTEAIGISSSESKRLLTDGLLELHRILVADVNSKDGEPK